jgi:hypothetical protein
MRNSTGRSEAIPRCPWSNCWQPRGLVLTGHDAGGLELRVQPPEARVIVRLEAVRFQSSVISSV